MKRFVLFAVILCFVSLPVCALAVDVAPRISDREIIEGLAEVRGDIKELKSEIKRVEAELKADIKRLEDGQRSIRSEMNSRFESVDKRLDMLMWMMGLFVSVSMVILGFVVRMQWQMMKRQAQMETALETQKDEMAFLKGLIERLLPSQIAPQKTSS